MCEGMKDAMVDDSSYEKLNVSEHFLVTTEILGTNHDDTGRRHFTKIPTTKSVSETTQGIVT